MESKKFDPRKLARLNDPGRLEYLDPDLIWETAGVKDARTVVDIGAGTGFFAALFHSRMNGGKIYACDVSDVMVAWMKDNLQAGLRDSVIPMMMEESSVPLPDGTADLVYMINLHHEFDDPEIMMKESHRLLRKDGRIAVIDWKKEETPEGPPLSIRVTAETIGKQMKAAGFLDIEEHPVLKFHSFVTATKKG